MPSRNRVARRDSRSECVASKGAGTAVPCERIAVADGSQGTMGAAEWNAAATVTVGGEQLGPFALDIDAPVTIGRSARAGIRSPNRAMPRELARLCWTRDGWIVENERHLTKGLIAPMRVRGEYITNRDGALFAPRAKVLLQPGEWTLEWDLTARITVTIAPLPQDATGHPVARDKPQGNHGHATLAPRRLELRVNQTVRMAALYAYLLRGEQHAPKHPFAEAAALAGCTAAQMKSTYYNVLRKVNVGRDPDARIIEIEELGYHLIHVEGLLGPDDLRDTSSALRG